jgi:hypothetical protein
MGRRYVFPSIQKMVVAGDRVVSINMCVQKKVVINLTLSFNMLDGTTTQPPGAGSWPGKGS